MRDDELIKLNEHFYEEVFRRRNVDAIDDLLSDDFVEHIPMPGQDAGRQGAKDFIGHLLNAFPDLEVEVEKQLAKEDTVAALLRMSGTHQADFVGVPATGKKVSVEVMDMVRINDAGKFSDHWGLADMSGMMAQLGRAPAPG